MSAVDVLAVMDESATQLDLWAQDSGLSASQFSPELREARAAVAELAKEVADVLEHVEDESAPRIGNQCTLCYTYRSRLHAALARVQGGAA